MTSKGEGDGAASFAPDFEDEIVDGLVRHPRGRDPPRADPGRPARERPLMSEAVVWLTIFILSVFVGIEVISKVSSTLHTPLMSGANAIHGVILLGAIIVTGSTDNNVALVVGLIAIVLAAVNMVGGFVVTDRMLQMFVRKKPAPKTADATGGPSGARDPHLGTAALPARRGLLHPRAQGPLRSQDRAQRQPDRRLRRGPGVRHPVLLRRPRPRAADPGRDRGRHGRRCLRRPHRADDPDAADGGAVQRRRRRRGRAGRAARAARHRRAVRPRRGHRASPWSRRRSRSWSARCPSPARSSPSPSCRS